jgi:type I restriction enzyme, R subunit
VVMATGAGKTRTVIALCDHLQRCNWVKRVLFLADRRALVKQAANAFKTHLPGSSPVNLLEEKEDTGSRVLVSTYPTMMRLVDEMQAGQRRFGVGHFDLVVIDEAHRSVYQKYGALFDYFDSLLVGLTATPKDEVDKNTYRLFELENGVPTFAYELDEAVKAGWLVPPRAVSVPLRFQREGIRYDDLPEEEKDEWDALEWNEEGEVPEQVDPAALNSWLFNADTVDKVLEHLMRHGLKVDGGDRLGKTILFAKNHRHAVFIQERFDRNYPHLKGTFARVIDNYEPYAQNLLEEFATPEKPPHLAISVDMLDTGVDIPEVVNLVFFKLVRSRTKFWQMVGRGTRLRPDLFGPGQDKECFYLFDYCQNLEFFGANPKGVEGSLQEPLGKKLFLRRLELLHDTRRAGEADPEVAAIGEELADQLHAEVAAMNVDNFLVRPQRRYVEQYGQREAWEELPREEADEIGRRLAGLPTELDPEDITARQFDLLLLNLQLAYLRAEPQLPRLQAQVMEIAQLLEEKGNIPLVAAQMELILELQSDDFWSGVTLPELERVRKRLRDLVKYIERSRRKPVFTDFEDRIGAGEEMVFTGLASSINAAQYRKKVMRFLDAHREHPAVLKLRFNEPLAEADLESLEQLLFELGGEGSREQFEEAFGPQESLGAFIRGLVGLERRAVEEAFARHLENAAYDGRQIRFLQQVIEYLTRNGAMDPGALYEQPFTEHSPSGLDGLFPEPAAADIVHILAAINANAGARRVQDTAAAA